MNKSPATRSHPTCSHGGGHLRGTPPMTRLLAAASRTASGRALASRVELARIRAATGLRSDQGRASSVSAQLSANHNATYRRIWAEAASEVGAEMEEFSPGYFRFRRGSAETVTWRHHVMLDSPATTTLAGDKALLRRMLADAGVPVVQAAVASPSDPADLLAFRARIGGQLVVKPARGTSGGAGVTCAVQSEDDLVRAWLVARRHYPEVLGEQQQSGTEYRLLLLDGQLLGAVRRYPANVIGDGRSTVRDLIAVVNQSRLASSRRDVSRLIPINLECILVLRQIGLTLKSVPRTGEAVRVSASVSANGSDDNESWRQLSPELLASAAQAAKVAQLHLAGIDLVTDDIRAPLEGHGVILEVNATPGLHYHYQVRQSDDCERVAVPLLDHLLV